MRVKVGALILFAGAAALLSCGQPTAWGERPKAAEEAEKIPALINYAFFTFPTQAPVAKVMYSIVSPGINGKPLRRRELVIAKGRVRLPSNDPLSLDLAYDSLTHMDSLKQLYPCKVVGLSAANLDFEDSHMSYLTGFKDLKYLNMSDTLITDKSLEQFAKFPKLAVIRLPKTNITGVGFDHLSKLPIRDLDLEGTNMKAGTIGKLKPIMAKMVSFNVTRTGLTKADAVFLKDLKIVQNISIATNRQVDNDCVDYLAHMTELKKLSIFDTSITDKSIPKLIKLPNLRYVRVRDKEFWTSKKHRTKYGQVEFTDIERTTTMPADFCIIRD